MWIADMDIGLSKYFLHLYVVLLISHKFMFEKYNNSKIFFSISGKLFFTVIKIIPYLGNQQNFHKLYLKIK